MPRPTAELRTPASILARPVPPAECSWPRGTGRLVGSGSLNFFGFQIYTAFLWARDAFEAQRYASAPLALEIVYERRLGGAAIAERSLAEMRRVGAFSAQQEARWLAFLLQAFPDIAAGDRLSGTQDGAGKVCFFHNGQATGCIADAEFADLFFGIWLSERSSAPALRLRLIGQPSSR